MELTAKIFSGRHPRAGWKSTRRVVALSPSTDALEHRSRALALYAVNHELRPSCRLSPVEFAQLSFPLQFKFWRLLLSSGAAGRRYS